MFHWLFHGYFWHPLTPGPGYNLWSGIAGSFLTSVPGWLIAGGLFIRHKNCHVKRCFRLGHIDPEHGHPACRRHHSQSHLLG